MNALRQLQNHGQSVWLDFINRSLISSGELERLIRDDGVRGLTSNPSIFEKAITETADYEAELRNLSRRYSDAKAIFEQLAIVDIRGAADAFRGTYNSSQGRDGFVSLEVSPELSHNTEGTLEEARRLWRAVGRDNLMIKVPGTPEGIVAFEKLISEGINVNVTLLFSVDVYKKVATAYINGLTTLAANGGNLGRVASVASFFVSRVDTAADTMLQKKMASAGSAKQEELRALLGKAAVANARLAYAEYQHIFGTKDWQKLQSLGAFTQRVLWASTGTKNPSYRDVVYVEELIGPDTVNTMPPSTMHAFRDHGTARDSLTEGLDAAKEVLRSLESNEISMQAITSRLLEDGERQFSDAFAKLLASVERVRATTVNVEASP